MSWLDKSVNENKGVEMIGSSFRKKDTYSALTEGKLEEYIKELLAINSEDDESMILGQYCRTNGFIMRSGNDLNLCNDSKCVSCQEFVKEMREIR